MALIARSALLQHVSPLLQIKRFRGKIHLKRPKPPHFERAAFIELCKPYFISPYKDKTPAELCWKTKLIEQRQQQRNVENPFQKFIAQELLDRLQKSRLIAFFHQNPMTAEEQLNARIAFEKEKMFLKNYGRKTLEIAVQNTKFQPILEFYVSRNMTVFSVEPELKRLLKISKKIPQLVLLAAIYEGRFINREEIDRYSLIPNLVAAQANLVQTLNSAGAVLASQLNSHQNQLVSHLDQRIQQLKDDE